MIMANIILARQFKLRPPPTAPKGFRIAEWCRISQYHHGNLKVDFPLTDPLTAPGARVISALSPLDVPAVHKFVMTAGSSALCYPTTPHVGPSPSTFVNVQTD